MSLDQGCGLEEQTCKILENNLKKNICSVDLRMNMDVHPPCVDVEEKTPHKSCENVHAEEMTMI